MNTRELAEQTYLALVTSVMSTTLAQHETSVDKLSATELGKKLGQAAAFMALAAVDEFDELIGDE